MILWWTNKKRLFPHTINVDELKREEENNSPSLNFLRDCGQSDCILHPGRRRRKTSVHVNHNNNYIYICIPHSYTIHLTSVIMKFDHSWNTFVFLKLQYQCYWMTFCTVTTQAAQAKDKRTPSRYKRYCVAKTRFIRVCMGTQRLCFRRYKIECFVNKNDLPCCCVVFFVVCQLLRPIWGDFGELYEKTSQ